MSRAGVDPRNRNARTGTRDVRLASALMVLDVPVTVTRMLDDRTGRTETTFYLGCFSAGNPALGRVNDLRRRFESGELEAEEPEHPLLDAMAGLVNEDRLEEMERGGRAVELTSHSSGRRWVYGPGSAGLAGLTGQGAVIKTADRGAAAALGVCGGRLVWLEGAPGAANYYVPTVGEPLRWPGTEPKRLCLGEALRDYRAGRLDAASGHPLVVALEAQAARRRLRKAVEAQAREVVLRHPRTGKMATFYEDAKGATLDRVRRFLEGS